MYTLSFEFPRKNAKSTLAAVIGKAFFPADNETLQLLLVWAGFAVGFGFRPLGAILPSYLWRFSKHGQFDRQTA